MEHKIRWVGSFSVCPQRLLDRYREKITDEVFKGYGRFIFISYLGANQQGLSSRLKYVQQGLT
jgi:hypothetical protein